MDSSVERGGAPASSGRFGAIIAPIDAMTRAGNLVAGLALCAVVFAGLGIYAWTMPDEDVAVQGEAIEKPAEAPTTDGSGLATPQDSDTAAPEAESAQ